MTDDKRQKDPNPMEPSAQRTLEVVQRLLRGEPLEEVSRAPNVPAARLSEWRRRALHPNPEGNFSWGHTFNTIEDLRRGLLDFARHDNATWMVARHGYKTPDQVRAEQRAADEHSATDVLVAA
jgi:hypothetical protein